MQMKSTRQITLLTAILGLGLALLAGGCKAEGGPDAGFADATMMTKDPAIPFHKVWRKPGLDVQKYRKLYIAPVNTNYMLANTDWQSGVRKDEIVKDVQGLADYTRATLIKNFKEDKNHRFEVVDTPGKTGDTLNFEFALVEVVPSKMLLNAMGYAPFGIGMAINAVRGLAKDVSSCAFEARGRDGGTGEVVYMAADREHQQITIVDARDFTIYAEARGIVDDWAKQFVQIANRKPGEKVEDTSGFRLRPW